jgi:hypothetical protein
MASVVVVASCRQLVGIGDEPPGTGSSDAGHSEAAAMCGGFAWTAGTCDACMESACCAEATACRGDPACGPTFDCLAQCVGNDDLCRGACFNEGNGSIAAALGSCEATSCSAACDLQCGGFFGLVSPFSTQECLSCYDATACEFATACAKNESCLEAYFCNDTCDLGDLVCQGNCDYANPVSLATDAGPGFGVGNNECAAACGFGTNWTCAGHAVWPIATMNPLTFQLQVRDSSSDGPLAGVSVRACGSGDAECSSPLSMTTTDSNGLATLTSSVVPFSGYLDLKAADAAGYMEQLQYVYPFLAESTDPGVMVEMSLSTTKYIGELNASAGVMLLPSNGVIAAFPVDCFDSAAPGVSFSGSNLGSAAQAYYYLSGTPTTHATATSLPTAGGGFTNVAPGLVTFVASANGAAVATVAVQVRAGVLTHLGNLVPTP